MKSKIQTRLEEIYKGTWRAIFDEERKFSFDDFFVNIAIVDEKSQRDKEEKLLRKGKNEEKSLSTKGDNERLQHLSSWEAIHQPKAPIAKEKLFSQLNQDEKKAPNKVLLLGRAGIGKSVLSGYLAHRAMVSEEKLWSERFNAVFLIRLRELVPVIQKSEQQKWTLAQIISQMCLYQRDDEEEDKQELLESLTQNYLSSKEKKSKVLLILDGWDEVASFELVKKNEETKQDENGPVREVLKTLLKFTNVLLTSRPYARRLELKDEYGPVFEPERVLEHMGFFPQQLSEYIDKFFSFEEWDKGKEKATSLQSFIQNNRSIQSLTLIPLHAELLCSLWSHAANQKEALRSPLGLSELYNKLLYYMMLRYLKKIKSDEEEKWEDYSPEDLLAKCSDELFCLQQLAYDAMVENESLDLLLPAEQLTKLIDNKGLKIRDLLHTQFLKGVGTGNLNEQRYYFIHLTFQEYFAARSIAQQLMGKDKKAYESAMEFIRLNKYIARYEVMFWFVAGLIKSDKSALERFWGAILAEPRDCIGFAHSQLVLRCLEECYLSAEKGTIDFKQQIEIEKEASALLQLSVSEMWSWLPPLRYTPKLYTRIYAPVFKKALSNKKGERQEQANLFRALGRNQLLTDSLFEEGLFLLKDKSVCLTAIEGFSGWIAQGKVSEEQIMKHLLELIKDEYFDVFWSGVEALRDWIEIKESQELVDKYLVPLMTNEDEYVREAATWAFERWIFNDKATGEQVTTYLLKKLLNDEDSDVRCAATWCFKNWILVRKASKEEIKEYLPPLLGDEDRSVREVAVFAFEAWIEQGEATEEQVAEYLIPLLNNEDEHPEVISAAEGALSVWESAKYEATENEGQTATETLEWIAQGKASEDWISKYLLPLLKDEDWGVRDAVAEPLSTWLAQGRASEKWMTDNILSLLKGGWSVSKAATKTLSAWVAQGKATEDWVQTLWPAIQNNIRILSDLFRLLPLLGEITLRNYLQKKQFYQFCLLPNEENEKLEHNKIYLKEGETKNSLAYSVFNQENQLNTGMIDSKELVKLSELETVTLETLQPLFNDILQILSKRGNILSSEYCLKEFVNFLINASALVLITDKLEEKQTLSITLNGEPYFKTPFYLKKEEVVELKKAFALQVPVKQLVTGSDSFSVGKLDFGSNSNNKGKDFFSTSQKEELMFGNNGNKNYETEGEEDVKKNKKRKIDEEENNNDIIKKKLKIPIEDLNINKGIESLNEKINLLISSLKKGYSSVQLFIESEELKNRLLKAFDEISEDIEKQKTRINKSSEMNDDSLVIIQSKVDCYKNRFESEITLTKKLNGISVDDTQNGIGILDSIIKSVYPMPHLHSYGGQTGDKENALRYSQKILIDAVKKKNKVAKAFKEVLGNIRNKMEANYYNCFITYAWPKDKENGPDWFIQEFLEQLQSDLLEAGINAKLDYKNVDKGENIEDFMKEIPNYNHWLMIGTPSLGFKFEVGTNVRFEIELEKYRKSNNLQRIFPMIPILVCGDSLNSFPWHVQRRSMIDFTENSYVANLKELLFHLTRLPKETYDKIWEPFEEQNSSYMAPLNSELAQELFKLEEENKKKKQKEIFNEQKKSVSDLINNYGFSSQKKDQNDKNDDKSDDEETMGIKKTN